MECGGLKEDVPHGLQVFKHLSPVGGIVWRGFRIFELAEGSMSLGTCFKSSETFLFLFVCFLCLLEDVAVGLSPQATSFCHAPPTAVDLFPRNHKL